MIFLDAPKLSDALSELVRAVNDEYPCAPYADRHDAITSAINAVVGQYMEDDDD
jgi:hypothetical protein